MKKNGMGESGGEEDLPGKSSGSVSAFREIATALKETLEREIEAAREKELAEAIPAKAAPEGGSPKWQKAVMEAIDRRSLESLTGLLDGAPAPVFVAGARYDRLSPLGKAARLSWREGVKELLRFGAAEPQELFEHEIERVRSALEIAAENGSAPIFRMLLDAEADPQRRKVAAAEALMHSAACFSEALDVLGAEAIPAGSDPFYLEHDHMSYGYRGSVFDQKRAAAALRLADLFPEAASRPKTAQELWRKAIGYDVAELAAGLALRGISPLGRSDRWDLSLDGADLFENGYRKRQANRMESDEIVQEGALARRAARSGKSVPILRLQASALAFACWASADRIRSSLLRSEETVRRTMESEDSRSLLSGCLDLPTLRELRDAGMDLAALRGEESGRNPLHRMARGGAPLGQMRKALALCPEWGLQADSQGLFPAAVCKDPKVGAELERHVASKSIPKGPKARKAKARSL